MSLNSDLIIDATKKGSISRFINHSCDPNAETQKWTVSGEVRIGFFSIKDIKKGEEITFDYKYERYGYDPPRSMPPLPGAHVCEAYPSLRRLAQREATGLLLRHGKVPGNHGYKTGGSLAHTLPSAFRRRAQ